jgi:hypothetical protein
MYYPEPVLEGLRKTTTNLKQNGWSYGRDSNREYPEYKSRKLLTYQPDEPQSIFYIANSYDLVGPTAMITITIPIISIKLKRLTQ